MVVSDIVGRAAPLPAVQGVAWRAAELPAYFARLRFGAAFFAGVAFFAARFTGIFDLSISIQVGAWSLAPASPRTQRSTPAATSAGASFALSRKWSMRRPALRGQCWRK